MIRHNLQVFSKIMMHQSSIPLHNATKKRASRLPVNYRGVKARQLKE